MGRQFSAGNGINMVDDVLCGETKVAIQREWSRSKAGCIARVHAGDALTFTLYTIAAAAGAFLAAARASSLLATMTVHYEPEQA